MRQAILLPFLFSLALTTAAQNLEAQQKKGTASYSKRNNNKAVTILVDSSKFVLDRISRVENGLLPPSVILGKPVPAMRLKERMEYYGTPGVSIAVINNYKIEWIRHYGFMDKEEKKDVTDQTIFQAGSISKPMTAFMIMKLVQQKKLELDKNIHHYLKSWKVPENELTRDSIVTIRKILKPYCRFSPL